MLVTLLPLSEAERAAYLDRECAGDAELRREVESLLAVEPDDALPALARTGGARDLEPGASPSGDSFPSRIGSFEVLGALGQGGMGIVLRARDTRLGRTVALKILPPEFASQPQRLARFRREAQLVAALNHPHIAQIYGLEESGATNALVMEFVKGMTLAERIAAGPMELPEAMRIARQIAEAIEAAHDRGIVHRDLKPANIMITERGAVKILDFGVAKALDPETEGASEGGGDSLATAPEGSQALVLGTPAYMSPEQIRRRPATRRVDIWAFGCVCFELMSGRSAFARESVSDTLAAVLTADPDWSLLSVRTPRTLRQVLARCLRRDERERLRDIGDVRILLDDIIRDRPDSPAPPDGLPRGSARGRWLMAIAAVVLGLAAGFGVAGWFSAESRVPIRMRALTKSGRDNLPAVSPNRRFMALVSDRDGRSRIWLKDLVTGTEQAITEGHDTLPQFTPDGEALLFLRAESGHHDAYRQGLVGGHPRKVVGDVLEACWSPAGDRVAFIRRRKGGGATVAAISTQGGAETRLFESDGPLYGARWSPQGHEIVLVESPPTGKTSGYNLVLINAAGESARNPSRRLSVSGPAISAPAWAGPGRQLIYAQAGSALGDYADAVARILLHDLDAGRSRTLFFAQGLFPTLGQWSLGRDTSLGIVGPGSVVFGSTERKQVLRESSLADAPSRRPLPRGGRRDRQPVYSPDGNQLLFSSDRSGNLDLWLFDFEDGSLRQLTDDPAQDWDPAFMPDGAHVLWSSDRSGHLEVWAMDLDGGGARQVTHDGEDAENPTATADGGWIVYWSASRDEPGIWRIRWDGTDARRLVAGSPTVAEVSPDGRWAAFLSQEPDDRRSVIRVLEVATGKVQPFEIKVPWPSRGSEYLVLGRMRWTRDARAIAYVGVNEQGHSGVYVQEYDPNGNSDPTRRPLAGFRDDSETESFGLSPDGRYITISTLDLEQSIIMAERVPGLEPPDRKNVDDRRRPDPHRAGSPQTPRF
jgi:serine/threonine protein kinase/Tol biopolymer transport system component